MRRVRLTAMLASAFAFALVFLCDAPVALGGVKLRVDTALSTGGGSPASASTTRRLRH